MACFHFKINTFAWQFYGPQCESPMSHIQVRMNEAEMLHFYSKLLDPVRGTNWEHLENVFVFVWTYKIKLTSRIIFVLHCWQNHKLTKALGY